MKKVETIIIFLEFFFIFLQKNIFTGVVYMSRNQLFKRRKVYRIYRYTF